MEGAEAIVQFTSASQSMYFFSCSFTETLIALNSLKPKLSCGIDEISNMLVIKGCFVFAPNSTYLINLSFSEGTFHQALSYAKVLPIYKSDSKSDLNYYRPIALSSSCGKKFEKIMLSRLYNYPEKFKII